MTPSQYRRLAPLFEMAMQEAPSLRFAFAQKHCGDDPQLLNDLLKLLRNAEIPIGTLDRPIARLGLNQHPSSPKRLFVEGFKIIRPIGRGGMGKVFEAVDRKTGATVAIKLIQTRGAFSEGRRLRFLLEARGMASMRHPNIVELYDIGQAQGHLYLVMEFLRGRSLRHWLLQQQQQPLPARVPRVLRIVAQTAEALRFAHSQSFVHGDVKPENIMVLDDGTVKLIDFGLARQEVGPSSDGLIGGTLLYMAPEMFGPPPMAATADSDVWALGVTLLECLTGKQPFADVNQVQTAAHHRLPAEMPLSEELNALVDRLLQKNSAQRLKNAPAVVRELERLESLQPSGSVKETTASVRREGQRAAAYAPPDLGLSVPSDVTLETKQRAFWWRRQQVRLLAWPIVHLILCSLAGFLSIELSWEGPSYLFTVGIWWMIIGLILSFAPPAVCSAFCSLERRRLCDRCGLAMKRASIWTRLANERTEVVYGQADCIAALKHGLWEEAAKLVSIHGKESISAYSNAFLAAARFRLEFFECDRCGDQAARLTAEDVDGDLFRARPDYFEAYRRQAAKRLNQGIVASSSYVAQAVRHFFRTVNALRKVQIHSGVAVVILIAAASFGAQRLLTWNHRSAFVGPVVQRSGATTDDPTAYYSGLFAERAKKNEHPIDTCVVEVHNGRNGPLEVIRPVEAKDFADGKQTLKNFTCSQSVVSASPCRLYCRAK